MKALVLSSYGQFIVEQQCLPLCGPADVLIQIAACGICGSDVHGYDGASGRRIPPIVMGHEAAGTITAVGQDVTSLSPGDRVTFDSTIFCAHCEFCLRGEINLCDNRQVAGVSCAEYRRNGAFAEYIAVPAYIVHKLPAEMPFAHAAMLEAVAVALHAVKLSGVQPGDTALVIGAGMIGLLTLQAAIVAGCKNVLVADVDSSRLGLASKLGASQTLRSSASDLSTEVLRLTHGRGVDVALEAVGRNETVASAIECTRKGATVTLIGNIASEVSIPLQKVVTRQIRLQGSCASAGEYPEAIELVSSGRIQVAPLISAVAPLEDAQQWFDKLHAREPNLMKVILDPRLSGAQA